MYKEETDYDSFIEIEVMLQGAAGGNDQIVKFTKKLRDEDIESIGTYHNIPLHITELYKVKYHNSELAHIAANIIVYHMFAQVD